jgi:thiol-disulfide isomerase/thioredoxin
VRIFGKLAAAAAFATVVVLIGVPRAQTPARISLQSVIAEAAEHGTLDFTLRDLHGKAVKLSQWRGHPVIVDFWATWCPPCRKQIPELEKLYSQYNKSRGLVVLGVACDTIQGEGVRAVLPFVREFRISYPILMASEPVVDALGVQAIPTTLFIDPNGRMVDRIMGAGRAGELTNSTHRLLDASKRGGKPDPNAIDI